MKKTEKLKYKYLLEISINKAVVLTWCASKSILKKEIDLLLNKGPVDRLIIWTSKQYFGGFDVSKETKKSTAIGIPVIDKIVGYFIYNDGYYLPAEPTGDNYFIHKDINKYSPLKDILDYIKFYY